MSDGKYYDLSMEFWVHVMAFISSRVHSAKGKCCTWHYKMCVCWAIIYEWMRLNFHCYNIYQITRTLCLSIELKKCVLQCQDRDLSALCHSRLNRINNSNKRLHLSKQTKRTKTGRDSGLFKFLAWDSDNKMVKRLTIRSLISFYIGSFFKRSNGPREGCICHDTQIVTPFLCSLKAVWHP